ncbi:HdeD family acid-resistance protein [Methanoregula sp.]|uniref:HdeD family acid-resistance protein n=1 Tax=Methanoregula sp. TaxID=2052170 RepID=UPI002BB5FB4B|nr:DUF308 domain-containing protein [Methanoregula sp.]HVP95960.1 DUF308 domain-containing protein [Methanoregula sp.]
MAETTASPQSCWCCNPGLFPWWVILLWGILSLVIGIMFLSSPGITTIVFVTFLGAYWLVGGIFSLAGLAVDRTDMGWKILLAVLNLLAGIIILAYPLYSTVLLLTFLVIIIGVWACITGCVHLYQAFSTKDAGNGVLGVLSLLFGILLLIFPLISAALVPFIAGIFAVVIGIIAIVTSFAAKKAAPKVPVA